MAERRRCGGSQELPIRQTLVPGYGICRVCGRPFALNKSGAVRGHTRVATGWDVRTANWRDTSK